MFIRAVVSSELYSTLKIKRENKKIYYGWQRSVCEVIGGQTFILKGYVIAKKKIFKNI